MEHMQCTQTKPSNQSAAVDERRMLRCESGWLNVYLTAAKSLTRWRDAPDAHLWFPLTECEFACRHPPHSSGMKGRGKKGWEEKSTQGKKREETEKRERNRQSVVSCRKKPPEFIVFVCFKTAAIKRSVQNVPVQTQMKCGADAKEAVASRHLCSHTPLHRHGKKKPQNKNTLKTC